MYIIQYLSAEGSGEIFVADDREDLEDFLRNNELLNPRDKAVIKGIWEGKKLNVKVRTEVVIDIFEEEE